MGSLPTINARQICAAGYSYGISPFQVVGNHSREKWQNISGYVRYRANRILISLTIIAGVIGVGLLPFHRYLATGAAEWERWHSVTISNATALLFLSVLSYTGLAMWLVSSISKKPYILYPGFVIVGLSAVFVAQVLGAWTFPFNGLKPE